MWVGSLAWHSEFGLVCGCGLDLIHGPGASYAAGRPPPKKQGVLHLIISYICLLSALSFLYPGTSSQEVGSLSWLECLTSFK